jgi:hypothetical protein
MVSVATKRVYALWVIRRKNKHAAHEEAATNEQEQNVIARIRAWRKQEIVIEASPI